VITLSCIHQAKPKQSTVAGEISFSIDVLLLVKEIFPQSLGQQFRALTAEKG